MATSRVSTPAGVLLNFASAVNARTGGKDSVSPFYEVIGIAVNAPPFTRKFAVALDGLREAVTRTKRWVDTTPQALGEFETFQSALEAIRFQLDHDNLTKRAKGHGGALQ